MSDEWGWEFASRVESEFQDLDAVAQQQLLDKLNEVVTDGFHNISRLVCHAILPLQVHGGRSTLSE